MRVSINIIKFAVLFLTRNKDGVVQVTEVEEPKAPKAGRGAATAAARDTRPEPPQATPEEAEAMGRHAFKDNVPITLNPFRYGQDQRGRWDTGWRKESGGDGMGPDRDDD